MTRILISVINLFFISSIMAQVPGYLGKRIAIDIGIGTGGNLNGNLMGYEVRRNSSRYVPVIKPAIGIEFSVSNKLSLSLGLTRSTFKSAFESFGFIPGNFEDYVEFTALESLEGVNSKYHFGYRYYFQGGVSPIGRYFGVGLAWQRGTFNSGRLRRTEREEIETTWGGVDFIDVSEDLDLSDYSLAKNNFLNLMYEFGARTMLHKSIFLHTSLKLFFPLRFKYIPSEYDFNSPNTSGGKEFYGPNGITYKYVERNFVNYYLTKYQFVNELLEFKISVGMLF